MNVTESTTHLLVDDSSTPFHCVLSKKIFQAVARHIFVVSTRWITACLVQNTIVDETSFEIHGDTTLSTMHITRRHMNTTLFSSALIFAIECQSFQRILTRQDLMELVLLTGGTLFEHEQWTCIDRSSIDRFRLLVVLVEPNVDRSQLDEKYRRWPVNVKFLTAGFLLKSIIYQIQQPFEDFEL
jgi:hypothetical protein